MRIFVTFYTICALIGLHNPLDAQEIEPNPTEQGYIDSGLARSLADLGVSNPDYSKKCMFLGSDSSLETANSELIALVQYLSVASDLSNDLLGIAKEKHVTICLVDTGINERGSFDYSSNLIVLREALTFPEKILIMVHELRHLDQFGRGFCPSTKFDMSEHVRLIYALEADAQAITTLSAWSMKVSGDDLPWATLSEFEKYSDISDSFSARFSESGDLSTATSAAFAQWYQSRWRLESYYLGACENYLDDLDRTKMVQSYLKLPDSFFDTLCSLPNGMSYECLEAAKADYANQSEK